MSKTVTPFIASLVQFNTTVPFAEVIARLDVKVNKFASSVAKLMLVKNQQELKSLVEEAAGTDFLCDAFSPFLSRPKLHLCKPQIFHGIPAPQVVKTRRWNRQARNRRLYHRESTFGAANHKI
jgi:hypothetical protein